MVNSRKKGGDLDSRSIGSSSEERKPGNRTLGAKDGVAGISCRFKKISLGIVWGNELAIIGRLSEKLDSNCGVMMVGV